MGRKYTKEEIIYKLDCMGFDLVDDYIDMRTKIDIEDKDGYLYNVRLDNLINSGRIPEKFRKTNSHSIDNIQHYLDTHSSGCTILTTEYKNAHEIMDFSCCECGRTYSASLNHVISRGQFYCNSCSLVRKGKNHRVSEEKLENEFSMSGLTLLDKRDGLYTDRRKCVGKDGKVYYISYAALRNRNASGYSTYTNSMSKNESVIFDYLSSHYIHFLQEYSFEDCKSNYKLRFDFAVFNCNEDLAFLIEIDGEQHFRPVRFGGMSEEESIRHYYDTIERDGLKDRYCINNEIELIRIPYYQFENGDYKRILDKRIENLQTAAV